MRARIWYGDVLYYEIDQFVLEHGLGVEVRNEEGDIEALVCRI